MIKSSFLAVLFDILSKIVFDWIFKDPRKTYSKPRSTYSQVFYKIVPLKVSPLCWSLFCNKVVGQACNLIEKKNKTLVQVFSWEFHKIFKNIYFMEYFRTNDRENICLICWNFFIFK